MIKFGDVFIFAKGQLDFPKDKISYNFNVNSTNPTLASLVPPFRAYGSLGHPHFVPSASGAVASVMDSAEGVVDSALGVVAGTASLILGPSSEKLAGREICKHALSVERSRISSRVGSALEK